jgi:hypothetical protein
MITRSASLRAHAQRSATFREPSAWLVAFWLLMALALHALGAPVYWGHSSHPAVHPSPSMVPVADHALADEHDHGNGAHSHTGNELTDLLTLGHSHAASGVAAVLPGVLHLAAVPLPAAPVVPWREHDLFQRPPSNPFRPPIA